MQLESLRPDKYMCACVDIPFNSGSDGKSSNPDRLLTIYRHIRDIAVQIFQVFEVHDFLSVCARAVYICSKMHYTGTKLCVYVSCHHKQVTRTAQLLNIAAAEKRNNGGLRSRET